MHTGIEYVEAPDVRRSPFRVAITPLPSLSRVLLCAGGRPADGTPQASIDAVRRHLRRADYETLAPFARPGPMLIPDALLGLADAPGESFEAGIERMISTPIDLIATELAGYNADLGDGTWDDVAHDPGAWMRRYAGALLRAWSGFGPLWEDARTAIEREVERIGVATARDAQLELLDGLLASGTVVDGRWCVQCSFHEGRLRFPEDGFVLMPMLASDSGAILTREEDTLTSVCYPIGASLAAPETPRPELEDLLGAPRARILTATGRPTSIGALAHAMHAVPSAATHHVTALEAAGLVERYRSGRHVIVRRTPRGERLLELYDDATRARHRRV